MKIKKIELKDYKLFKGKHSFKFSDKVTLIEGPNGSGKTILFKAIKESLDKKIPGVSIEIEGDLQLFRKYSNLIFLDEELLLNELNELEFVHFIIDVSESEIKKGKNILGVPISEGIKNMIEKGLKYLEEFKSPRILSTGDRVIFAYLYFLKKREETGIALPLIIDSPFCRIESGRAKDLFMLLKRQKNQLILFGIDKALDGMKGDTEYSL